MRETVLLVSKILYGAGLAIALVTNFAFAQRPLWARWSASLLLALALAGGVWVYSKSQSRRASWHVWVRVALLGLATATVLTNDRWFSLALIVVFGVDLLWIRVSGPARL
jgi:hypothetical protein